MLQHAIYRIPQHCYSVLIKSKLEEILHYYTNQSKNSDLVGKYAICCVQSPLGGEMVLFY